MRRASKLQGFSLIELAIVITVIALVVGAGISMGSNSIATAKRIQTQERLATIKSALENYARQNDYLPCPSSRALTPNDTGTFGVDPRPGAACAAASPGRKRINGAAGWFFIGAVPVRTLGLPDSYAADGWGNKFLYAVGETSLTTYATATPALAVYRGDRMATNYAGTTVTDRAIVPSTKAAITPGYGASYVVLSHGPSGGGAYPLYGSTMSTNCITVSGNANDVGNCTETNAQFWESTYVDGGAIQYKLYDDFIVWGSNALARPPISTTQPPACVTGCEAWCAPCTGNLPNSAPGNMTAGTAILCKKIVVSNSPCQARCVWAGTVTVGTKKVMCP